MVQLPAPEPTLPEANDSGVLVWASGQSGIWLAGLAESQRQVFDQPAFTPAWSLEGETLYFFAEEGLYLALAPAFEPVLIGEGLISGGAFWLRP